jgi:hypothetical protein
MGLKTVLMGRFKEEVDKINPEFYMKLYCIAHQQPHWKNFEAEHYEIRRQFQFNVMDFIISSSSLIYHISTLNTKTSCTIQKSDD